jgi:hypothetical protein
MVDRLLTGPIAIGIVTLALVGCPDYEARYDFDGDGVEDSADCAPEDETIYPGADDAHGDEVDSDCDACETGVDNAGDGVDRDCDGYPANEDLDEQYADKGRLTVAEVKLRSNAESRREVIARVFSCNR